ncbi:cysteine desulfurase family protein [Desulfatitalea tepidiphila]|uniref:cysteine desulfurase family protein n=1 Tax=Desulfatitalea tepidiphila TaxID=1185843 RepID=UPI000AFB5832|nr:cysteine desulfurase family protein [Desulfatitalea tepidiphila]
MVEPIYLDYNGTTPLDPEVIAAMRPFLEREFGNPSSSHWYGIKPKQAVEGARRQVAGLLNCRPDELFFTSGGTESNNHAIKGIARSMKSQGRHIVTSAFEHPAVLEVCRYLAAEGFETTCVPVDDQGMVDPGEVERALRPDTILVTVMHANNEVGTVQPIAEIAAIARRHGIPVHTDAAQSLGKIPVDVQALGADLLSVAGHKLYAPKGIGALYVRRGLQPEKFCHGAGQERGWRAGTENVPFIVALGKACEIAGRDLPAGMGHLQAMRDRLHHGIADGLTGVRLNGHPDRRLPNTLSLAFRNLGPTAFSRRSAWKWPPRPAPPVTPIRCPFPTCSRPCSCPWIGPKAPSGFRWAA